MQQVIKSNQRVEEIPTKIIAPSDWTYDLLNPRRHFGQVDLPDGVLPRLGEYEDLMGVKPGRLVQRYVLCPYQYSLDRAIAITSDPIKFVLALANTVALPTQNPRVFGFSYYHIGLILNSDQRENGPEKRTTLFCFDPSVVKIVGRENFVRLSQQFSEVADLSNHDPLHSVNGLPKKFTAYDRHLRYGGVEFLPIALHAALVQKNLRENPDAQRELKQTCSDFLNILTGIINKEGDSPEKLLNAKLYFCANFLRYLLLALPANSELVFSFLKEAQNTVFKNQSVMLSPIKYRNFLIRDFSIGNEADTVSGAHPSHSNRNEPYNHGRDSMIGPFLWRFYAKAFGFDFQSDRKISCGLFLLLETLRFGHGIYGIASAQAESENRIGLKEMTSVFLS